ncbi:MAG: hypothetical protein AB7G34_10690 [Hyphomicrobiales bacterium]
MSVSPLSPTLGINRSILDAREQLSRLHEQLASGKKVTLHSELGLNRTLVLATRQEFSQLTAYKASITQVDVRLDVLLQSAERMRQLASESKTDALEVGFELQAGGQTIYQTEIAARLDEVLSLMNSNVGGRYFYGGRDIETPPVLSAKEIMDGAGALAGFKQVASERLQADLGADGRGRLMVGLPAATVLGGAVADPADIGGAGPGQITIDIGGNAHTFDISDGGLDTLADLEAAIDAAFGSDVASIVGGNQLQLTAPNVTDSISITEIDAGAAALAGLTSGTLVAAPNAATLAEDAAGSPFGFKLAAVHSTLSNATVTGPGGSPAEISAQFTGQPQNGETVRITLDQPDGTQHELLLVARTAGPAGPGEFLIGADAAETAANFAAALGTGVEAAAQRSLTAASHFQAANDFFNFDASNPPQRVDGPPFDTATAMIDATPANTIYWYQGEVSSTSARASASVKVDDSITINYGARADEPALRDVVKAFAAMSVMTFSSSDTAAPDAYEELRSRTNAVLTFTGASQSMDTFVTELSVAKVTMGRTAERHTATLNTLQGILDKTENADVYEVSAQILTLQNRLEASLQVSVSLSRLSLVNFL